ncbi:RNA-binding protein 24-A-like [Ornithodoros turicata]|uniref:RNA-binding protein 24-A-like n=1 Tax=Ornithodoros turicata TaxID=34597 RepID=UPI0031395D84
MVDREPDENPIIDGGKANANLDYLGAKPRANAPKGFPLSMRASYATLLPSQYAGLPHQYMYPSTYLPTLGLIFPHSRPHPPSLFMITPRPMLRDPRGSYRCYRSRTGLPIPGQSLCSYGRCTQCSQGAATAAAVYYTLPQPLATTGATSSLAGAPPPYGAQAQDTRLQ